MPKNTRRITVTRTVTYTTTIDTPGIVHIPHTAAGDTTTLTQLGGANGATGVMAIAELLAGSDLEHDGTISKTNWSISSKSDIEPYITRPKNTALPIGTRVASTNPSQDKLAALGKLFVVVAIDNTVNGGKTADSNTEPAWHTANGGETTDGGITYRTIPKFPNENQLKVFAAATVYGLGTILKPSDNSLKEFLVITATTSNTTAQMATALWVSQDKIGTIAQFATGAGQTAATAGRVICIAGCQTYAYRTQYSIGDLVKPADDSSEEYLVIVSGRSNTKPLDKTEDTKPVAVAVGGEVVHGTAKFRRIV